MTKRPPDDCRVCADIWRRYATATRNDQKLLVLRILREYDDHFAVAHRQGLREPIVDEP